jgi:cysteinyl-tRNA synthetase
VYSCGPTVYSRAHLGNMRAYVFADTVRRALLWKGFDVRHVVNITDVGHLLADADLGDDKVELAARSEQRSVWDLTEHYTNVFKGDAARLELLPPERGTKATGYIDEMIAFARRLEAAGHAYRLTEGLYFDTSTISGYGAMATMAHDADNVEARIESVAVSAIVPTSLCGARSLPTSLPTPWSGTRRGAGVPPAGISSARS